MPPTTPPPNQEGQDGENTDKAAARVFIEELSIRGDSIQSPDAIDGSAYGVASQAAFDVNDFVIAGQNISLARQPGENLQLKAQINTAAAGNIELNLSEDDLMGSLRFSWSKIPPGVITAPTGKRRCLR